MTPPFDVYEYWELQWTLGPAADGLAEYFDKWYAAWPAEQAVEGGWRRREFTGLHEYLLLDDGASRCGARLRYAAVNDGEEETLWAILEGMTDLGVAWRFDLIEAFRGEPSYEALRETVRAYWSNELAPRLLMQIDASSLEFFFVPRED